MQNSEKRRKRIKALVIFILLLLFTSFVAYYAGVPMVRFMNDPEGFREWVNEKGAVAPVLFVLMVLFQVVVAVVPGEPFEIAAGYAFGYFWGTALFMIGAMIGSAIIFLVVRRNGQSFCYLFFDREKISELKFLKNTKRNKALYFIIFALPGTPKDMLSYFAGLSDMRFWQWMLISSIGRLPALITSVIGGGAIGNGYYFEASVVFGIAIALSVAGYFTYGLIIKKNNKNKKEDNNE